jgi:putative sigma-54 modulation protein
MKTEIIGRNVQVDDRLRRAVEAKLRKLEKFLDEPIEMRATLGTERHRHVAELHVTHRLGVLQGTEESDGNLLDAVQRAATKVEEQARRSHGKLVDKHKRRRGGNHRWPVEVLDQGSVGAGGAPRVIETSHLDIKPMTIDEAALELEGSEQLFVVFRDSLSDRLSVLYKRKDQNYGLIAPEL